MTVPRAPTVDETFAPGMFEGPAHLRHVMPLLRRVPASPACWALAALAVADGVFRRRRFRLALEWAGARGATGVPRWRLAAAVLGNHGRFVAEEAMLGVKDLGDLRRGVVLRGAEHLESATAGAILLGFHLGPPSTSYILQAFGYPVRPAGRFETAAGNPQLVRAVEEGRVIPLPGGAPIDRTHGLHRLLTLLRAGSLVYLMADGPFGREAFRIELPGRPLIVRGGWLALRRQTGVPALPVLTFQEGGRRVIVVHPPLPAPDADRARDAAACRAALTPLVADYVRRFPAQCRYLVFPPWLAEATAPRP